MIELVAEQVACAFGWATSEMSEEIGVRRRYVDYWEEKKANGEWVLYAGTSVYDLAGKSFGISTKVASGLFSTEDNYYGRINPSPDEVIAKLREVALSPEYV